MDRSELELQKAAEMVERSRDVLARTRSSNAKDESDSHWSVDDKVVCHPNETDDIKEEILEDPPKPLRPILLPSTQVLNLTRRIGDDELLEMKDLGPNNSDVVPNMVPPASPNGGDDIVMVQQPPRSLLNESSARLLPPTGLLRNANLRTVQPGAVAVPARAFTGQTSPSVLYESQGPSAIDEQSVIMGELMAEPSEEDQELRRRYQELQHFVNQAVTGTVVIVENSGACDHDQNATSSPSGRKSIILLIVAVFALLLVVGVILGVTIPLTTNNDNNNKDSPSIDSAVTPAQSPAPTKAPTAAPTACTSLDCLAKILIQNEVLDAETLQDESSPQFLALRWLANDNPVVLNLDGTPSVILVERYVLAVLYFATSAEGGLNEHNFLTASSVCEWQGVSCNGDDLVVALLLGKSKHKEVIVLISKFRSDSPVYFPFRFSGVGE
jgi:hypothetical protein